MRKTIKKSIVLLSSGLDSLVSLAIAKEKTKILLAITIDYGQRAAKQEILHAKKICRFYKVKHKVIKLPWLAEITDTALVNKKKKIPQYSLAKLNSTKQQNLSAKAVWVPNRNAVFINIAASYAESLKADLIITGFNKEEGSTFPDNTKEFVAAANEALEYSTLRKVQIRSFVQKLTKAQIAQKGKKLKVDLNLAYSCYTGKTKMCGTCESCLRLKRSS